VRRLILPDALRPGLPSLATTGFDVQTGGRASSAQAQANLMNALGGIFVALVLLVVGPILLPLVILFRRAFERPWWVEARSSTGAVKRWRVRGWDESARVADEVARALERGEQEPKPAGAERVTYWGPKSRLEDEEGQGFYARRR
jgi:hypothetical protein